MNSHNPTLAFQLFKVSQEQFGEPLDKLDPQQYQDALRVAQRKIHIEQAVLSSAEASRVAVASTQIDTALDEIKQRYEQGDDFSEDIKRVGVDEAFFYQALSRELHVEAVLDFVSAEEGNVSDTEVSLFYYMNLTKFKQPEIRTARHILVTINEEAADNTREFSLKKITQIADRLTKKPARFEEQALKHSECPTSLQGGLLGKVKRGVLYPEIEAELFQLSVGEHSSIIESPLGFHLLRCDEIQHEGVAPLQEVQEKLKQHLQSRKRKQRERQWLEGLLKTKNQSQISNGDAVNG
ncbi:peptidyl-prolyl cis-trans isomerase C [Alteromonadaceae bacterium Bs31]|nr:peptidyl-prolyl cis-trans isomerase C [Alteromonadaceae bacterium Bs31]